MSHVEKNDEKVRKEMVIGTDEEIGDDGTVAYRALPSRDTIDTHIAILKVVFANDGRPIEAHDLDTIAAIRDRCDRLSYWAVEESTTFGQLSDDESKLAAAVPLCAQMLASPRPKVIAAAVIALAELVGTPSNAKRFLSPVKLQAEIDERVASGLELLAMAMTQCPQQDETLARCCVIARKVAQHDIEAFLVSDVVALILKAMERHKLSSSLQKEATHFFASVVALPRANARDIPVSILMTHVGVCLPFVLHAYKFQPTCSGVAESVASFLKLLTERPENIEAVANSNALQVLCHIAAGNVLVPHVVENAFAGIASILSELDPLQKRSVASTCFTVMTRSVERNALAGSFALLLRIVDSFPPSEAQVEDGSDDDLTLFKMYVTQQQIPRVVQLAVQHFGADEPIIAELGHRLLRSLCLNRFRF